MIVKIPSILLFGSLLFYGTSFAGSPPFPIELYLKIFSYCPGPDLLSLGHVNKSWRTTAKEAIESDSDRVDLSQLPLSRRQFECLFRDGGILGTARNVVLSHLNFQGDWIDLLPTEKLGPRENGKPRLRVLTRDGAEFTYLGRHPVLGHGWRDPHQLAWFGPLKNEGKVFRQSLTEAQLTCEALGGSLPLSEEWESFSKFLGWQESQGTYLPQVFSDLDVWYWVLPTPGGLAQGKGRVFNGKNGGLMETLSVHSKAFRCVFPFEAITATAVKL